MSRLRPECQSTHDYLALPAVSASLITTLLDRCPRAAWFESWLNPDRVIETSPEMDMGTVAHAILLEGSPSCCEVIDPETFPSKTGSIPIGWTNNAIREARDAVRLAGKIPILLGDFAKIMDMVNTAKEFIASLKDSEPAVWVALQSAGGESEATYTWDNDGILCKMRPDRISKDMNVIINYKTTSASVEPDRYGRTQFLDYYVGAAFYRRGIRSLFGIECDYVFLCQETAPPYLCSLVGMDPAAFEIGDAKVEAALKVWRLCVQRNEWPSYPPRVCYPSLPAFELARWEERQAVDYGSQP